MLLPENELGIVMKINSMLSSVVQNVSRYEYYIKEDIL